MAITREDINDIAKNAAEKVIEVKKECARIADDFFDPLAAFNYAIAFYQAGNDTRADFQLKLVNEGLNRARDRGELDYGEHKILIDFNEEVKKAHLVQRVTEGDGAPQILRTSDVVKTTSTFRRALHEFLLNKFTQCQCSTPKTETGK